MCSCFQVKFELSSRCMDPIVSEAELPLVWHPGNDRESKPVLLFISIYTES